MKKFLASATKTKGNKLSYFIGLKTYYQATQNEKEFRLFDFSSHWSVFSLLDFSLVLTTPLHKFAYICRFWPFCPIPTVR
jgi:hypothetical protein